MSITLNLLTDRRVPIKTTMKILSKLGFEMKESITYYWFDEFQSKRGCWLNVRHYTEMHNRNLGRKRSKVIFESTTTEGRNYHDLEMQNKVIEKLYEVFGGIIYSPNDETCGFLKNDLPELTQTEIAFEATYWHFKQNLERCKLLIEDIDYDNINDDYFSLTHDVSVIKNNVLILSMFSIFENFLRKIFSGYMDTNEEAYDKILSPKGILYTEIEQLVSGEKSIAEMEVDKYSLQNIESIINACKKYMNFNVEKEILSQSTSTYNYGERFNSGDVLEEFIGVRNQLMYKADLNIRLTKYEISKYLFSLNDFAMRLVSSFLKNKDLGS
ncbi:hypothetical protein AAIE21_19820 [Paenibacillus sp. 102]|uniref:hypothetical protein n=1 Tax=Paenibacillus sp. 102 TaxID=3120823 RepID=UPI0031BB784E